jgi:trimethylamine--corrinoid protein Co-methyltransferase
VIDDEIIAAVRRYLRGFSTDEESLAVEEVRRVGICGSFLDTDHTFSHFREEVFLPERLVRVQRMSAGERADLVSRAVPVCSTSVSPT